LLAPVLLLQVRALNEKHMVPLNNRAERAIRPAVLWRKTSSGTQTTDGDRFVGRILSIRESCRCQNRPLHPYLIDVHNARLTEAPIPMPLTA
jgi:transposase